MDRSASAEITLPNADRDLLILAPSLSLSPVAPVLSALSLPDEKINLFLDTNADRNELVPSHTNLQFLNYINLLGHRQFQQYVIQ